MEGDCYMIVVGSMLQGATPYMGHRKALNSRGIEPKVGGGGLDQRCVCVGGGRQIEIGL